MAKKQKIVISDEELKPTVLFTVKERKVNFLAMILLFGIFIAVIYVLPTAYERYDLYRKGLIENPFVSEIPEDNKDKDSENTDKPNVNNDKYEFKEDLVIENNDLILNNFKFVNNVLSFDVTNKSSNSTDFTNKDYYLSVYNASNSMLKRIKVAEDTFKGKETKTYIYNITAPAISSFIFKSINEEDYPIINLQANENGEATLTCKLDNDTIVYSFIDNKLTNIKEEVTVMNTASNYAEELTKYQELYRTYNEYDVNALSVVVLEDHFTYTLDFDPAKVSISKLDKNFYDANTLAKTINYELEARGYTCN